MHLMLTKWMLILVVSSHSRMTLCGRESINHWQGRSLYVDIHRGLQRDWFKYQQKKVVTTGKWNWKNAQRDSFLIQTSWMRKPSWSTISTAVAMPFHPEIPFWPEPYWELLVPGQAKRHTSTYCNYCITGLMKTIPKALDNVSLQNIQNYFQCVRDYMYGYLLGHQAGIQLEELVKNFSKQFKSIDVLQRNNEQFILANYCY